MNIIKKLLILFFSCDVNVRNFDSMVKRIEKLNMEVK